jgi:thiamine biosynthesis lipoprotein
MTSDPELSVSFDCLGSTCAAFVIGAGGRRSAEEALDHVRMSLIAWHERFSRFLPASELSRLNADPRTEVPVSALMARFARTVGIAGAVTRGLVDATLIDEIQTAGYAGELGDPLPLATALGLAPDRKPASGRPDAGWQRLEVSLARNTVTRPPGVKLDSGGLAKGLFADVLAEQLSRHASFAVNCGGDLLIGGTAAMTRAIKVQSPFDGSTLHTFNMPRTGVATSGIGRRAWLDERGRPAHHLLDPSSGRPAFTGIVQVTALAPSAMIAEIHAKAAILGGPRSARAWLPYGGVIVADDGSHEVVEPPPVVTLRRPQARSKRLPVAVTHDV